MHFDYIKLPLPPLVSHPFTDFSFPTKESQFVRVRVRVHMHLCVCTYALMGFTRVAYRNKGYSKGMGNLPVATPLKKMSLTPVATTNLPINRQRCAELGEPLPFRFDW